VVVTKLTAKQLAAFQKELEAHSPSKKTRALSAHKVMVTLFEENAGQQLDMGMFIRPVPIRITSNRQPLEVPLPMMRANILGDVSLSSEEEGGKIDFKFFPAKYGKTKKVTLFSRRDANLSFVACDPALLDLDVLLKKVKDNADKTQWQMDVTAKPNRAPGLLPENGVIVLRCEFVTSVSGAAGSPSTATKSFRLVRIPVIGTAESSH
jgi:hypothetical protein